MRPKLSRYLLLALTALAVPGALHPQEVDRATLEDVKTRVLAELAGALPAELPPGYTAILPPEIVTPDTVDATVATTWSTALAAALGRRRPDIELTERTALEAILREQKFGDSVYADPATAAAVGKLAAARTLLLTRLHEFRPEDGRVRVHLEAILLDVETGANLWSKVVYRGFWPTWLGWLLAALVLVVAGPVVLVLRRLWLRRRRRQLVGEELPAAQIRVRVDVDGLVRAITEARERLFRAGDEQTAAGIQEALVDLEPVLDRGRHALPGGAVDRHRVRDLAGARREAQRIAALLAELRQAADRTEAGDEALGERLRHGTQDLRRTVDAYRGHLY